MSHAATRHAPHSLTAELRRNRRRQRTGKAFQEPGSYMAYLKSVLARLSVEVETMAGVSVSTRKAA